jgi:xanthine dehydrogenase accessory factor
LKSNNDTLAIMQDVLAALEGGPALFVFTITDVGSFSDLLPGGKIAFRNDVMEQLGSSGDSDLDELLKSYARTALARGKGSDASTVYISRDLYGSVSLTNRRGGAEETSARILAQLFTGSPRLLIVGGGHVALALARVGEIVGFEIVVTDDRESFANEDRFPMATIIDVAEPSDAIPRLVGQAETFIVLVSRGHRLDEDGLRQALKTEASYIGMIGSKRRTETVLRHMAEEGVRQELLDAVSTPIGLNIGAETPEEIAVAIVAEILMLRNGESGNRMIDGARKK